MKTVILEFSFYHLKDDMNSVITAFAIDDCLYTTRAAPQFGSDSGRHSERAQTSRERHRATVVKEF